jgi:O-antigen/teichoic acid export membrane protein
MKAHLSNAICGVLDYAAYPVGMLLAAPLLLHHLGVAQYGVWVVATAAVTTGSIIASGFGDAAIQHVASIRGQGNTDNLVHAVRSMVGINLILGVFLASISWAMAPLIARHVTFANPNLRTICLSSLRIGSPLMLVRAIESVCISTQRAFERYGAAVRVSIIARLLTLVAAVVLAWRNFEVTGIMIGTAVLLVLGTIVQLIRLKQHLGASSLMPSFDRDATKALFNFGAFSWLQAVTGVMFTQADRLILGVSLGATAVTSYVLCVQISQPIYGLAASGLHFLFPYLAGRYAVVDTAALKKTILIAFGVNLLFVGFGTAIVLMFGRQVLNAWMGPTIAMSSSGVLGPVTWSFALLGLSVTGYYALLAFGRVRAVTLINIGGGTVMLLMMILALHRTSIHGVAMARLCYGLITLLMYYPLTQLLNIGPNAHPPASVTCRVCEDV